MMGDRECAHQKDGKGALRIGLIWGSVSILALCVGLVVGFWACDRLSSPSPNPYELRREEELFATRTEMILKYIQDNEGWIPGDLPKTVIAKGYLTYRELTSPDSSTVFWMWHLPPRISTDLQKNARVVLCLRNASAGPGTHVAYTDGTHELLGIGELMDRRSAGGDHMRRAGYSWDSPESRVVWIQKHGENLGWNDELGMYVSSEGNSESED